MPGAELKILYGPPGTGKTFLAAREAVRIIDGSVPPPSDVSARHKALQDAGQIIWVTFHPSYSYEDFVEGYRPRDLGGNLTYRVVPGPFRIACESCRATIQLGDRIGDGGRYEVVEIQPGGVLLRSRPNRSDQGSEEQWNFTDYWTINHLRSCGLSPEDVSIPGTDSERKREMSQRTSMPLGFWANSSHYRAVWTALDAAGGTERSVVLVIDEMNRADLSRVFGELITLIELDKRQGATEYRTIRLPYSGDSFSVPASLSIVGTMNSADRSLAVLDLALRRRFEFDEIMPDESLCPAQYGGVDLQARLRVWNDRITAMRSREYQLGHADLMQSQLDAIRSRHGWSDDDDGQSRAVAASIRLKLVPLLQEYFPDDWRKIDAVLGTGWLEPRPLGDVLGAQELELVGEISSYSLPEWWDPDSAAWDRERFVQAMS